MRTRLAWARGRWLALALACAPVAAQGGEPVALGIRPAPGAPSEPVATITITEFRLEGSRALPLEEAERALSPFLGPGKTGADIDAACEALQKAHKDAGYETVSVKCPWVYRGGKVVGWQVQRGGIVLLQVSEAKVGRLRVRGARWFLPEDVRRLAPSVGEGTVPDFDALTRDIVALNQLPDRRVTPMPRPGVAPGTIDVDLSVEDGLPLHGSLELNDRHGVGTRPLRLSGALRYDNLWQAGHTLGVTFQIPPQSNDRGRPTILGDRDPDARNVTASYVARFEAPSWLTLSANATWQDSRVQVGGADAKSNGKIAGLHAAFTLPGMDHAFHSVSAGLEYRAYGQDVSNADGSLALPITYWPVSIQWAGSFSGERSQTSLDLTATGNLQSASSAPSRWDDRRYGASPGFFHLRASASRSDDVGRLQLVARLQGQAAWEPLLPSEQFTLGGAESVRGYTDAAVAGDFGASAALELRTGAWAPRWAGWIKDLRALVFADGGWAGVHAPLPEQRATFWLAGAGVGVRLKSAGSVSTDLDLGFPLVEDAGARRFEPVVHFRAGVEF